LADWLESKGLCIERDLEELPWQLQEAGRLDDLRNYLINPINLASLCWSRGSRETIKYWHTAKAEGEFLDAQIPEAVERELKQWNGPLAYQHKLWFANQIAEILYNEHLFGDLLLRLRILSLELAEAHAASDQRAFLIAFSLLKLASTYNGMGNLEQSKILLIRCQQVCEQLSGADLPVALVLGPEVAESLRLLSMRLKLAETLHEIDEYFTDDTSSLGSSFALSWHKRFASALKLVFTGIFPGLTSQWSRVITEK
jgi:hypothetical protein